MGLLPVVTLFLLCDRTQVWPLPPSLEFLPNPFHGINLPAVRWIKPPDDMVTLIMSSVQIHW
ncbi:MAG: hypothetical protein F6J90_41100 [Moorea sp. SIOASIH]|nr:hypothetical protein [Moorena sp. SIOASIH]NEO42377.1 hypothetical protein [Moorena sp. SIOASIH]